MSNKPLEEYLIEECGYTEVRKLDDGRVIGLCQMLYTVALSVDLSYIGLAYRYCYPTLREAREDFLNWNGNNSPPGNWIVRKGLGQDLHNNSKG